MRPGGVRSFALELARGPGGAYRGGERLCGRVLLEAAAPLRVRALEVAARGGAATHWLEGRSVGVSAVSSDYAAVETYLRRRQLLLRGEPLPRRSPVRIPRGPLPGSGRRFPLPGEFRLRGCVVGRLFLRSGDLLPRVWTLLPGHTPTSPPNQTLFPKNPSRGLGAPLSRAGKPST